MNLFYKIISILTSLLFIHLFQLLLFDSASFLTGIGLSACDTAVIFARRASAGMLGFAVLTALSVKLKPSYARQIVSSVISVVMYGFASAGLYEYSAGTITSSILQAVVIELSLATAYLVIFVWGVLQPQHG